MVFHTTLIFISQSSTVLRKNCLCQHFLQNIILHAKKERDLSRKYRLWLNKARHTLKGTIVVFHSYDINIYTPAFHRFEKKLLMSGFLERNSFLLSQRRTWLVTQIHVITKKSSTYTQGDYSGLSYDINIYIPEFHRFEKKLLMSAFFTKYRPVSKKRTWFVTQIQIITKKSSTYTQRGL